MTRRIASWSAMSSIARSVETTSPHWSSARRNSQPNWPPAPIRRILGGIADVSWESRGRYFRKSRMVAVSTNQLRVFIAPRDRQIGIAPQHSAFVLRMIEVVALVDDLGDQRSNYKAVRKASGNENLSTVVG